MTAVPLQDPFVIQATEIVGELQDRLSRLLESQCGSDLATTRISQTFGIHRKLAWQFSRVAYDRDPLAAARHMPSAKGVQTLLAAARKLDIDANTLAAIEKAAAAFDNLVVSDAGDRASVDLMLSACSDGPSDEEAARWRQQSFVGNSYTWGAQCRTLHSLLVQFPSEAHAGYFDMAQVRGMVDFRVNKPHTHWMVNQSVILAGGENARSREPLDAESARACGGTPVMRAHCKGDLPRFLRRENADLERIDDLLIPTSIGLRGERTIVTGEVIRALAPAHALEDDRIAHFGMGVRTPAQHLVFDLFVHRDVFVGVDREPRVFSDLHSNAAFAETDRINVPVTLQTLGWGLAQSRCREIPGYTSLVRDVFDRLDQSAEEFQLFRIEMAYPPMPGSIMIRHPLPDKDPDKDTDKDADKDTDKSTLD